MVANIGGCLSIGTNNQTSATTMSEEESLILEYLRSRPASACAKREIARKAVHRTVYEENPRWVDAPLQGLLNQKLIEVDESGNYHIPWDDESGGKKPGQ